MTDLRSPVQIVLQDAGYETWLSSVGGEPVIVFEDDAVMGFACIFANVSSLLQRWYDMETAVLTTHASALQRGGDKTWNVYCVFLCSGGADRNQAREVRWIEEDLERTRKIAACGLTNREQIVAALLPLLPFQYRPVLDSEEFDVNQRLKKRISDIASGAASAALDSSVPASEVVRILGDKR
jgi:hypothetical protein